MPAHSSSNGYTRCGSTRCVPARLRERRPAPSYVARATRATTLATQTEHETTQSMRTTGAHAKRRLRVRLPPCTARRGLGATASHTRAARATRHTRARRRHRRQRTRTARNGRRNARRQTRSTAASAAPKRSGHEAVSHRRGWCWGGKLSVPRGRLERATRRKRCIHPESTRSEGFVHVSCHAQPDEGFVQRLHAHKQRSTRAKTHTSERRHERQRTQTTRNERRSTQHARRTAPPP